MKRLTALLLSLALLLPSATAVAANFSDLSETHWAHADLTRAVALGILSGRTDGTLAPDAPLSWGEMLTMLARGFYPEILPSGVADGGHWALPAYSAALSTGMLAGADFLPVSPGRLDEPLTRQDTAVLLDRLLREVKGLAPAVPSSENMAAADWDILPEPYRAPVLQCYARTLLTGYPDGRFGGSEVLTRATGAVLLLRCRTLLGMTDPSVSAPPPSTPPPVPPTPPANGPLTDLGCNDEKLVRLYGHAGQTRYPSQSEAEVHMVAVTVPVWHLADDGSKSPSTLSFRVHSALAEEITAIFTEIFNDPEQFPIKDAGGYDWRGDSAKGEHNCGTAIDLNYNENYQIYTNGAVGAGSCWEPGVNPFSIPAQGSVVRIFKAHGFSWGGDAWPTNRDYMHFSYMGL